jgi:hypothetical protein
MVSADLASAAIATLRTAAERGDADAVAELLAPDVVLHSPLTGRVRFQGREDVAALHRDIFAVLDDLRTTAPLVTGDERAFSFRARVRGVELEAMVLARFDDQAQIVELTIFGRPLPAVATLFAALPPRVSARLHGRPAGVLVALVGRPVAFVVRTVDRVAPRFL